MIETTSPVVVNIHRVHGRQPFYTLYIGRHTQFVPEFDRDSKWCNPFTFNKYGKIVLDMFEVYARSLVTKSWPEHQPGYDALDAGWQVVVTRAVRNAIHRWGSESWDLNELTGHTLGCWCKPGLCHGDIWIKLYKEFVKVAM